MAESSLTFDHDDVGAFVLERGDDLRFDFAGTELRHRRIQRDGVLRPLDERGLPGADHDRLDASGVECLDQEGGGRALADRPVCAENGDPGAGHIEDAAREQLQVLPILGATHIRDRHAGDERGGREFRIVVEEFVQPVDQVHPLCDRVEEVAALAEREHAAGGGDSEDHGVRNEPRARDRAGQVRQNRDARGDAVEDGAGVATCPGAVDDAEDPVLLGMADEAVRGLAVLSTEVAFAIDDGRSGTEHDSSSENPEEATKLSCLP